MRYLDSPVPSDAHTTILPLYTGIGLLFGSRTYSPSLVYYSVSTTRFRILFPLTVLRSFLTVLYLSSRSLCALVHQVLDSGSYSPDVVQRDALVVTS